MAENLERCKYQHILRAQAFAKGGVSPNKATEDHHLLDYDSQQIFLIINVAEFIFL